MNTERAKRLEKLYGDLRQAYSLLTFKDKDRDYYIAAGSMYGGYPVLSLTYEEVDAIARWKIEALEVELLAYHGGQT